MKENLISCTSLKLTNFCSVTDNAKRLREITGQVKIIGKDRTDQNGLLDSEGEGEGGMIWENGIVTGIVSCKN